MNLTRPVGGNSCRWSLPATLIALLFGVGIIAAACGGSSVAASASGANTTVPSSSTTNRTKFVSCLEAHGVPAATAGQILSGTTGGQTRPAGSTPATTPMGGQYAAAFQACRSDLDLKLGSGGFRDSQALKRYLDCLEQHGVTVPSTPPAGPEGGRGARGPLQQSPEFAAAATACKSLRPDFDQAPPPPGTTTSTTG